MCLLTELCRSFAINCGACPIVRPCDIPILAQSNHRLDCEGHPWLALADGFILCVVGYVWRTVEQGIYPMTTVGTDRAAVVLLGVLLDDIAKFAY